MVGILVGGLLGLVGLIPGLHFAMVLLSAGPLLISALGLVNGLLAMVASVGVARAMHTLTVIYHPVAGDQLASADPAQRLRAAGQGEYARRIMGESLWLGVVVVTTIIGVSLVMALSGINPIKSYLRTFSALTWPAIFVWVGFTILHAKNKASTALVFAACGLLGIIALDHPSVRGSSQTMTPLLAGIFGIPVLIHTILHKPRRKVEVVEAVREHRDINTLSWVGIVIGLLSVTLPGLGTSSLVSTVQNLTEDDAQYLRISSIAESVGELFALLLGVLSLASRSSDAAVISQVIRTTVGEFAIHPQFPWAILATLITACWLGLKLVNLLALPYRILMNLIPLKIQSILVALGILWVVWSHTGSWGISIMLAGTIIHFGARKLGVPNQAFFACIVVPMCFSMLGIHLWP